MTIWTTMDKHLSVWMRWTSGLDHIITTLEFNLMNVIPSKWLKTRWRYPHRNMSSLNVIISEGVQLFSTLQWLLSPRYSRSLKRWKEMGKVRLRRMCILRRKVRLRFGTTRRSITRTFTRSKARGVGFNDIIPHISLSLFLFASLFFLLFCERARD